LSTNYSVTVGAGGGQSTIKGNNVQFFQLTSTGGRMVVQVQMGQAQVVQAVAVVVMLALQVVW
jgi:hypothetical protein